LQLLIRLFILFGIFSSCGPKLQTNASDPNFIRSNVSVSWTANLEKAVNTTGGGYVVAYSQNPSADYAEADKVTVPYISGPTAPVTATINIPPGTYYIKIYAFSALNPPGGSAGSLSGASVASIITVP
jgi:hypothetical protein